MYIKLTSDDLDEMYLEINENPTLIMTVSEEDPDQFVVTYYTAGDMIILTVGPYLHCKMYLDKLVKKLNLKYEEIE